MATVTKKGFSHVQPSAPGRGSGGDVPEALTVTITRVAKALGVTRKHVSTIVNGRAP